MKKLLAALIAGSLLAGSAHATTHRTFDNETAFFTYLIEGTIELYSPKLETQVKYRELFVNDTLDITFPFLNTNIHIETPFHILDRNWDGASIKIEYRF
jgi:hypothetical protein